ARAVHDCLADTERDRNGVGEKGHPQAERNRHRHLLADQLDDADVAEIAVTKIEAEVVPQHQAEALIPWLVEAELLLEPLDEFRIEALRAAIARADDVAARLLAGVRPLEIAAAARNARGRRHVTAGQLRDHALDRSAGRELDHGEAE